MQAEQQPPEETFCWDLCDYTAKQVLPLWCDAAKNTNSNSTYMKYSSKCIIYNVVSCITTASQLAKKLSSTWNSILHNIKFQESSNSPNWVTQLISKWCFIPNWHWNPSSSAHISSQTPLPVHQTTVVVSCILTNLTWVLKQNTRIPRHHQWQQISNCMQTVFTIQHMCIACFISVAWCPSVCLW